MQFRSFLVLFILVASPLMAEPKASTQSTKQASTLIWTSLAACFIVGISLAVIIAIVNKDASSHQNA